MGSANSSNASEAITNVTTNILQDTVANVSQITENKSEINLDRCNIIGTRDVVIESISQQQLENNQIASSNQNADVTNDISQSVMQEASSTVGSMGVGFANASNSASLLVNSSTTIRNSIRSEATQASSNLSSINCNNSTIVGRNINISSIADSNVLTTQVTTGEQVASVINKVSQTASQKATASVEGMASGLIALAILIAAIGYAFAAPLSSGAVKIIIVAIIILALIGLISFMYVRKTPPFFNDLRDCSPISTLGGCDLDICGDIKESSQTLETAPIKYLYGLISPDDNEPKSFLLDMVINGGIGNERENGGYNVSRYNNLKQELDTLWNKLLELNLVSDDDKPPNLLKPTNYRIPNSYLRSKRSELGPENFENFHIGSVCTPGIIKNHSDAPGVADTEMFEFGLVLASTTGKISSNICPLELNLDQASDADDDSTKLATINTDEWKTWLEAKNTGSRRAKLGRFILYFLAGNQNNIFYIHDDELVAYTSPKTGDFIITRGGDSPDVYKFLPRTSPVPIDWRRGLSSGGTLTGLFGVCQDRTYNLQMFIRRIGVYIALFVILICIIFILKPLLRRRRI